MISTTIVKIRNEAGETVEQRRRNYLFENEWQSFQTGKNPILEFTGKAGKYKVMVKVVDILGIDTSKVMEVHIK